MLSPRLHKYNSPTSAVDDLSILEMELAGDRYALLLWSNDRYKDNLVDLNELKRRFSVELIDSDQNWDLYSLDTK